MTKRTQLWFTLLIGTVILALGLGFSSTSVSVVQAQDFGSNWLATYYTNTSLAEPAANSEALIAQVNFNYGTGGPARISGTVDNFSVRWQGLQNFATSGLYRFTAVADDGIRVSIDGTNIINNFVNNGGVTTTTADVNVTAGDRDIVIEYVEFTGNATVQVFWQPINAEGGTAGPTATPGPTALPAIPAGALTATVIRAAVLNTRDAPSLGSNVIGRILRGETYAVIGRNEDATWFILQLGGYEAWVYGYYLFVNGNEFNAPIRTAVSVFGIPPGFNDTGVIVQTRATMRLRAEPNVTSMQTGRITWGALLPVSGRTAAGDWYQVLWKGTVGWVFTGFLEITEGEYENIPIVE
ncbi:MAG: SH3 domain-containing protein [Chloroflexota bacterium]